MGTVPTPYDWVAGTAPTAAQLDAGVRDVGRFVLAVDRAFAWRNAAQTIANGTDTAVNWPIEYFDNDGLLNSGTPTRFTISTPGIYLATGMVGWAGNSTGYRVAALYRNGAIWANESVQYPGHANACTAIVPSALVSLSATDYLELKVRQNSGAGLNVSYAQMSLVWVGSQ